MEAGWPVDGNDLYSEGCMYVREKVRVRGEGEGGVRGGREGGVKEVARPGKGKGKGVTPLAWSPARSPVQAGRHGMSMAEKEK